ncbi:MAG: hypothetical protein A4S16_07630 [Proteobacteria bacterium SG_bin6]|nr:MAG: hypothetical protein A4S16_07630 [Proteobacteria bacterium SG_bin6]
MRWWALAVVLLGLTSPARAEWFEASNAHFVIYGDLPRAKMQQFADRLERFDAALRQGLNLPATPGTPGDRVTIYVVRDQDAVVKLHGKGAGSVAGFYIPRVEGPIAITPRETDGDDQFFNAQLVLFHEYTHHAILSSSSGYYPGWAGEGLAEFFSVARFQPNGDVVMGAANNARAYSILTDLPMSVTDLIATDTRKLDAEANDQKYARGWLLIHYLLLGGKRPGQFDKFMAQVNKGVPAMDAAKAVFGDLRQLNRELDRYREGKLRAVVIASDKLKPLPVSLRALDPGEAAMMPLRIRSTAGVNDEQAKALIAPARAIAARYPEHRWVQRVLAEMEFDAGNLAEADAACDRVLAAEPSNVDALVYKGSIEARRARAAKDETARDHWKAARRWFVKANRADPNYAYPFVLFYSTFAPLGETPNASAVKGLEEAVALVPQADGPRVMLAYEKLRAGDLAAARAALAPVAANPHGGADNPASKLIALIDSGADVDAVRKAAAAAGTPQGDTGS